MSFPSYNIDALVQRARDWLRTRGMEQTSLAVYHLTARLRREELQHARHHATMGQTVPCATCGMEKENPQHLAACPDGCGAHDYTTAEETHDRPANKPNTPAEATADIPAASSRT